MTMFEIFGKPYAIDLCALSEWLVESSSLEKQGSTATTITGTIDESGNITPISQEHTLNGAPYNETMLTLRYGAYQTMMEAINTPVINSDGVAHHATQEKELSLGQVIALNSLIKAGILVDLSQS